MKQDIIDLAMKIIFIIISIILIYWMIQILLGGSSTLSQMNTSIIVGIVAIIFTMMIHLSKQNREIGEIKTDIKHNFERVKEDMNRIENKIDNLK
jgi:hypothetical protein